MEAKTLFLDEKIHSIPLSLIDVREDGHRGDISEERIISMATSIRRNGLIEPLFLRKNPDRNGYILVSGMIRYFALCFLRARTAPSIILSLTAAEAELLCMIKDTTTNNLSEYEKAEGYLLLLKKGKFNKLELADALNTTTSVIEKQLTLLLLTRKQRNFLQGRGFSINFAYRLVTLPNEKKHGILNRILLDGIDENRANEILDGKEEKKPVGKVCGVFGERIVLNSVNGIAEKINVSGGKASVVTAVDEDRTEYRLIIENENK